MQMSSTKKFRNFIKHVLWHNETEEHKFLIVRTHYIIAKYLLAVFLEFIQFSFSTCLIYVVWFYFVKLFHYQF